MIRSKLNLKPGQKIRIRSRGISYEGILKGFTEEEVYLQTPMRTWTFRFEEVSAMERIEGSLDLSSKK